MFGTMGFSELIIILVIVLIIFGAGRLPQIGEGVGKALKGFKKEVNEIPPTTVDPNTQDGQASAQATTGETQSTTQAPSPQTATPAAATANQPYQPGPELTPGTTAAMMYKGAGPEVVQPQQSSINTPSSEPSPTSHVPPPVTMEERAHGPAPVVSGQYPPLPASASVKPTGKRPSAIVNKQAVARIQAQQAANKAKASPAAVPAPQEMQSLGEGLGSALRTFREATADIRNSIDPEMRTIQAELESAEKEVQETIESAKQPSLSKDPPATT